MAEEKQVQPKTVYIILATFTLLLLLSGIVLFFLQIQSPLAGGGIILGSVFAIALFGFWTYQKGKLNLAIGIAGVMLGLLYLWITIELLLDEKVKMWVKLVGVAYIFFFFTVGFFHLKKRREREPLKKFWRSATGFYYALIGVAVLWPSIFGSELAYAGTVLGSYILVIGLTQGFWQMKTREVRNYESLLRKVSLKTFLIFALEYPQMSSRKRALSLFGMLAAGSLLFGLVGFRGATIEQQLVYSVLVISFHVVYVLSLFHSKSSEVLVEENARIAQELRTAHDMQMGLMPKEDPVVRGFDISGICIPASEVGGDFFDYVWLDGKKTKLGIALADVSGKAMKAAMTAVMTSGLLCSEAQKSQSPRQILARMNQPLYLRSDKRVFTALSFAVVDLKSKKLTYSSAGQSHPILVSNAKATYLKTDGVRLPLGVRSELNYRQVTLKLRKTDSIVFYTDGVPEAMKADGSLYGFERFEDLLKRNSLASAKQLRDAIVDDVKKFTGNVEQHDDMTVVVVKVT